MSTNDSTEFHTPIDGPVIRKYSKLNESKEAARLAASKAQKQKESAQVTLVDEVIPLKIVPLGRPTGDTTCIEKVLPIPNSETERPRPNLPCDMEAALRYATNDADTPFGVLEKAFKNFLGTSISNKEDALEFLKEIEKDLEEKANGISKTLTDQKKDRSFDPQRSSKRRDLKQKLKALNQELAQRQEERCYLESFTPGQKPPPTVAKEAEDVYVEHWKGIRVDARALAYLSEKFHPFWETHRAAYLGLHAADEARKKKVSAKNRESGSTGLSNRVHPIWIKRTKGFIETLNAQKQPHDPEALRSLAKSFAITGAGRSDERTHEKIEEFLSTLANAAIHGKNAAKALELLRASRVRVFKALPPEVQQKRRAKMSSSDALALKNDEVPKRFTCFRSLTEGTVSDGGVQNSVNLLEARRAG